jgi:hypothetical protein
VRTLDQTDAVAIRHVTALTAAAALVVLVAAEARAACEPSSASDRWRLAAVVVDARALEGPTATGVQRFRVLRYLKGGGPAVIRVATGVARDPDGSWVASGEGLFVRRGERWRIFARGPSRRILRTSICDGSWRHGGSG